MRPPCLPHVTMSGISARRPLPRQGLKQAASSGVGPLAFWSASGVPLHSQGVPGAVRRSWPLVTGGLARALELTTEVRHRALFAGDSATDSGGIVAPFTRVQLRAPRARFGQPPIIILGPAPSDRSRGQEPVVTGLARVRGRRPAFRRTRPRMK